MLLFIEGYPYERNFKIREGLTVEDALSGVVSHFNKKETTYSPEYVGYCYSKAADDVIFFLPKVVLTGAQIKGEQEDSKIPDTIFGADPLKIIDFESEKLEENFTEDDKIKYKDFLSELSIWIYRTISVYKKEYNDNILESREIQSKTSGRKVKHNTLLDVIIALRDFNRNNQDYLTFIARNMHRGFNKIQWTKTISKSQAVITNDTPIYIDPVNKKKVVNFDEELLVIYFSILRYITEVHGFSFDINLNYNLIPIKVLKSKYIGKNYGTKRLLQIKYKYFSDKALRIWDLCYAFFDREHKISMRVPEDDYLLAKDFQRIFELMIDKLVGGNEKSKLPSDLTDQKDGKLVDHMYIDKSLLIKSLLTKELTYYIGDSKYYKRGEYGKVELGEKSIYKQYTYARNVVQWNMNMFLRLPKTKVYEGQPQLRDELTEGYNPIPNFFISAHIPEKEQCSEGKFLSFEDDALHNEESIQLNRQFENRLFDRDTLLLCHYDVNFLFIVSLYGRDKKKRQEEWREKIRKEFRRSIQETLNKLYSFYTLQPRAGMNCYDYIKANFHKLNGKIYRPQKDGNYLILALMKKEAEKIGNIFGDFTSSEIEKNDALKLDLESYFHVSKIEELQDDLVIEDIPNVGTLEKESTTPVKDGVLMVMMENYDIRCKYFLTSGKIAIGIRLSKDSMEIVEHLSNIGFVLFHHRSYIEQHLFAVKSACRAVAPEEVEPDRYKNISTTKMFVAVDIDTSIELDSSTLDSTKKEYTKETNYDAQFAFYKNLQINNN